jgi:hypothetical protein
VRGARYGVAAPEDRVGVLTNLTSMDDFPTKIADLLENIALKIRAMTVDRVRGAVKWVSLGLIVATLALLAAFLLLVGLFRMLGELIGVRATYATIGGLFVALGVFLSSKKTRKSPKDVLDHD